MFFSSRVIATFALAVTTVCVLPQAHAQGEERAQPPREDQADTRRMVSVTLNPLALVIQRYGANVEVTPFAHHGVIASLYGQAVPMGIVKAVSGSSKINENHGASLGGELGYRLYSGSNGADGAFVSGSFVSMPLASARRANDLASADLVRFNALGAALDIGVQKVTESGFTVGGGIGVMYLSYELPSDALRLPVHFEPHLIPRLLMVVGWSF